MKRNIILISITLLFIISTGFIRSFLMDGKPDQIIDLEDSQKSANEKYITAQILSQSLDNVYKLFESNLSFNKNDKDDSNEFMDYLTDVLYSLGINHIETKYPEKNDVEKSGSYIFTPYVLEIESDYEQFGQLIAELERSERLIVVNEFNFNNTPENVRRTGSKKTLPDARISMEIATITINKSNKK